MKRLWIENKWKRAAISAVAGICLFGAAALAEDSTIQYPVKRIVRGKIMSLTLPSGKGTDGKLDVNEKIYQINSRTIMVDESDRKTDLSHFSQGVWVYMVVDLYADHREALFIAPISGPDQNPPGATGDQP